MHIYQIRPRKDHRGVDLISDALPFGRLWYDTPDHAIGYAMRSTLSRRRRNASLLRTDEADEFRKRLPHARGKRDKRVLLRAPSTQEHREGCLAETEWES